MFRLGQIAAKGDNIERFLLGRQVSKYFLQHLFIAVHKVFVVCLVFFAAKLTTIHGNDGEFLFYVPEIVQVGIFPTNLNLKFNSQTLLLETGLLACVIVVIVAQLTPQIVASIYPVRQHPIILDL